MYLLEKKGPIEIKNCLEKLLFYTLTKEDVTN